MASGHGYREDIDGLRAFAIISVIFYHYGSSLLQGGFVGVDVFFVISGYLITQIVRERLVEGSFSFEEFYVRRVRRIAPALIVMLLATVLLGWAILLPVDLENVGKGLVANSLFSSNILFWRESGYFDLSSHINPLLHTWSLAVEEQFYFFLPALLFLLRRRGLKSSIYWVGAGSLASFALCVWMQGARPTATFYLMPFRAWELGVGVLIALVHEADGKCRGNCEVLAWIGILLMIASFLLIQPDRSFPGVVALVPVMGAGLLIYSGGYKKTLVARALSWSPFVKIGLVSYSLYLWHWPIYVYAYYLNGLEPIGGWVWLVAALVVALSIASYRLVELPIRYGFRSVERRRMFGGYMVASLLVVSIGSALIMNSGFTGRFSPAVVAYDSQRDPEIPYRGCWGNLDIKKGGCLLGDTDQQPTVFIWGDSHALAWAPIINEIARGKRALVFSYHPECPPLIDVINPDSASCATYNDGVLELLARESSIKKVVLHASWGSYSVEPGQYRLRDRSGRVGNDVVFGDAADRTVKRLIELGKEVVVLGATPGAPAELPLKLAFSAMNESVPIPPRVPYAEYLAKMGPFYTVMNNISRKYNVKVLDPSRYLCDTSFCNYVHEGRVLYRDAGHLSYPGALFLATEPGLAELI